MSSIYTTLILSEFIIEALPYSVCHFAIFPHSLWRTSKDNLCILHVEVGSSE